MEKREKVRLEVTGIELIDNPFEDWAIRDYPMSLLTRFMLKANEIGLQGKKIKVVEVQEKFATNSKYIDFVLAPTK